MSIQQKRNRERCALEPSLELHEVVREPIDAGRRLRVPRQERERDGLLVDIHPDVEN